MKGLNRYFKYMKLIRKLNKLLRIEREAEKFYNEIIGDFDDTNLRNIKARINKVDELWLKNNMIN